MKAVSNLVSTQRFKIRRLCYKPKDKLRTNHFSIYFKPIFFHLKIINYERGKRIPPTVSTGAF